MAIVCQEISNYYHQTEFICDTSLIASLNFLTVLEFVWH